ncbi:MAG: hypothetical protein AAFN74_01900 [Myxococcota bacterium]
MRPSVEARPPLPTAREGAYIVERIDRAFGREVFTVTSSAGLWRVKSTRRSEAGQEGFALTVDEATAQPLSFEVWKASEGLHRTVRGVRDEQGYFDIRADGVGGPSHQRIPYAPGTMIDAASPVFKSAALALLSDSWSDDPLAAPIAVRTIRIDGPRLRARVVLSKLRARKAEGTTLVRLSRTDEPDVGLWVDRDGWPVQMRVLDPRWQWRLEDWR